MAATSRPISTRSDNRALLLPGHVTRGHILRNLLHESQRLSIALDDGREKVLRLLHGNVRRDGSDVRIDVRLEQPRPIRRQDFIPRGSDLVGPIHPDACKPERFGEARVRKVRQILRRREFRIARECTLFPGDQVEIAVVQHEDDQAWIGPLAVLGSGAMLVAGGLSLLTGVKPKLGAARVTSFLTGVTPRMHDYWNATDQMQRMNDMVNFTKNLALIGGAAFAAATHNKPSWRLAS